ncbi:MAG: hypothetical protein ACYCSI_07510 [Solirubrobacteraceae bacterium]
MSSEPTEEQLRAYEEELSRLSSVEIAVQAAASLISIGGRRLGLAGGGEAERDLEQVRDAIDGARALMPILERRMPAAQVNHLKGALSQLQMGYARVAQLAPAGASAGGDAPGETAAATDPGAADRADGVCAADRADAATSGGIAERGDAERGGAPGAGDEERARENGPGPAEASGRLWVPGR